MVLIKDQFIEETYLQGILIFKVKRIIQKKN
jgi:hypothetical protein